jgi:hypothetical protein
MSTLSFFAQIAGNTPVTIKDEDQTVKRIPNLKLLFLIISLMGGNAASQDIQEVFLNGERLTQNETAMFEQLAGTHVPSGHYWVDVTTGLWGYGDSPSADALNIPEQSTNNASEEKEYFEDRIESYGISVPSTVIYP